MWISYIPVILYTGVPSLHAINGNIFIETTLRVAAAMKTSPIRGSLIFKKTIYAQLYEEPFVSDLCSIVEWGDRCLVPCDIATKTNWLQEETTFCLLGLTFTLSMDWKSYIQSIAKAASREVGSFYRAQHFLNPESILYINMYKSTIRPCMEYCPHIWGLVVQEPMGLIC